MSDERTFTETELKALITDAVTRETATATQRIADLETELTGVRTKLDVAEAGVTTEKAARETAEQQLADFKTETEAREAATARRGEREKKVREAAAHLTDDYFTDEKRDRWAAMPDGDFDAYVAEVAELSKDVKVTATDGKDSQKPPRETAMTGQTPVVPGGEKEPALRRFLGLSGEAADEKKEA